MSRFIGLGNISKELKTILAKVRAPIERGIDKACDWIAAKAKPILDKFNIDDVEGGAKADGAGDKEEEGGAQGGKVSEVTPSGAENMDQTVSAPTEVKVHFRMDDEDHELTFQTTGNDVEVFMASAQRKALRAKFRDAHATLDNYKRVLLNHGDSAIVSEFEARYLRPVQRMESSMVAQFKQNWKKAFPGPHRKPTMSKAELERGIAKLTAEAEKLLAELSQWAKMTGADDLSSGALEETLRQEGGSLYQKVIENAQMTVDAILAKYQFRGRPIQYGGSLARGARGVHKGDTRMDELDFDVDMYVVHAVAYDEAVAANAKEVSGKIFPDSWPTPEFKGLSDRIGVELGQAFPGVQGIASSTLVLRRS